MQPRSFFAFSPSTTTKAAVGLFFGLLSTLPAINADLACTQPGSNTFHNDSTLKFTWTDTQTEQIDTFNLNFYCAQSSTLIQNIATLNSSSPATYAWVIKSALGGCPYNQYQGAFEWSTSNSETGALVQKSAKCKVMLLISDAPGASSSNPNGDEDPFEDEPSPSSIVVSNKTKSIVIGVGCAVGLLVLAGIVGFYVIRYSNKRAAQEQLSKKLREPLQSGPLFAPKDRSNGSGANGRGGRYNELASVTTGSDTMGHSPATTARTTEMVQLNGVTPIGTPVMNHSGGAFEPRSPTPIAAAHAKANAAGGNSSTLNSRPLSSQFQYGNSQERPSSLLTSTFIPADEASGRTSPFRTPSQQQHYQNEIQMQQQQQQQIQQQLQHQQQQQAYSNGYY
ncbi:hypothetical protein FBU30_003670 [Linnemannia zychae]|nr:hypothetical protein FBU30_003670 [Linnemannia zychae]